MKKLQLLTILSLIVVGMFTASNASGQQCKLKQIKKEYKNKVEPYVFEGVASGYIFTGETARIPVTLYANQKYRLFFFTDGFDGPVTINIITRNRFVVWTNKENMMEDHFTFIPKKSDDYFVEFVTPKSADEDARGCVAVILASRGF
jgi:hypothetical protein